MAHPAIVKTDRLILRVPLPEDAADIARHLGQKDVAWNMGRTPLPYAISDANAWIESTVSSWIHNTSYSFVITLTNDRLIGGISLDLLAENVWEIGYWIGVPWWGRGYATEAASAIIKWANLKHGLDAFVAGHFLDNPASARVLTKLGFEPVGEIDLPSRARGHSAPSLRYICGAHPEQALHLATH